MPAPTGGGQTMSWVLKRIMRLGHKFFPRIRIFSPVIFVEFLCKKMRIMRQTMELMPAIFAMLGKSQLNVLWCHMRVEQT